MADKLSYAEARNLVQSGDWMFWDDVWPHIKKLIEPHIEKLLADEDLRAKVVVMADPPEWEEDRQPFPMLPKEDDVINILREQLDRAIESRTYIHPFIVDSAISGLPVGDGKILKITPTLNKIMWAGLGIIGSFLMVVEWNALLTLATFATTAGNLKDIGHSLLSAWERLEDPKEYFLFKIITALTATLTVKNYNKWQQQDPSAAVGYLIPTMDDIEQAILAYRPREEVPELWRQPLVDSWRDDLHNSMNELKRRNILRERDGRWSFVF